MYRRNSILALMILSMILPACSRSDDEADRYLGRDRDGYFKKLVKTIADTQIVSQNGMKRLGTTWERELEKTKKRFVNARTRDDVYYALLSLKNSYHDMHSELSIPDEFIPEKKRVELPITFRVEYNQGRYEYVVIETAEDAIPVGSVLVSVDGRTHEQLEEDFREWHDNNSPEHLKFEMAKWLVYRMPDVSPMPDIDDATTFEFQDPDTRKTMTKVFQWAEHKRKEAKGGEDISEYLWTQLVPDDYKGRSPEFIGINYIVYPTSRPNVKIVRYHSFYYRFDDILDFWNRLHFLSYRPQLVDPHGANTVEMETADQSQLLDYLSKIKVRKVLFDVRENGGGELNPWFIGHLTDKPFNIGTRYLYKRPIFRERRNWTAEVDVGSDYMAENAEKYFKDNPGAKVSPEYPFFCKTDKCEANESIYQPEKGSKRFDFVVLTGPYCASSCDHFLDIMKENGIAKIAGIPSRAAQNPYYHEEKFSLQDGTPFGIVMSVGISVGLDKKDLEGNPAEIDIPIPQTRENRYDYLGAALKAICGGEPSPEPCAAQ